MDKTQEKFLCVEAMCIPFKVHEGEQLQEDMKLHCVGVQQTRGAKKKCLRETKNPQEPMREECSAKS